MAFDAVFVKMPGGVLAPADPMTEEYLDNLGYDQGVRCKITKARNLQFHRKFFQMLKVGYEAWEAPQVTSQYGEPQRNFDRFRADVVILAGFYEVVTRINGEVRIEPKSISFANMDEQEFKSIYNKVVDVLLSKVLVNYNRQDLDEHVQRLMDFA